jgi:hypothetical protein
MFACRPVPGFGIGCEDNGAMALELDRTDAGILWERDSRIAAMPQLQSSCGGSVVRLTALVSAELLKKGSGKIKEEKQTFYNIVTWELEEQFRKKRRPLLVKGR